MPPRQLHSSLASNADRMFPITDSACSLTIVAVIVCHAYYKFDRIDVPHCPNVILSVVLCKSLDQELSLRVFIIFHQVKLIKIRNSAGILNLEYIHYRYIVEKLQRFVWSFLRSLRALHEFFCATSWHTHGMAPYVHTHLGDHSQQCAKKSDTFFPRAFKNHSYFLLLPLFVLPFHPRGYTDLR